MTRFAATGFVLLAFSITSTAFAKEIKCTDLSETSHTMSVTNFSSTLPVLWSDFSIQDEHGNFRNHRRHTYLSAGIACGVLVDFKAECTIKEKENNLGYQFAFTCPQKKITGSFYVDETGFGQFQCQAVGLPQMNAIAYDCTAIK